MATGLWCVLKSGYEEEVGKWSHVCLVHACIHMCFRWYNQAHLSECVGRGTSPEQDWEES